MARRIQCGTLIFSIVVVLLHTCAYNAYAQNRIESASGKPHPANIGIDNEKEILSGKSVPATHGISSVPRSIPYYTSFETPEDRDGWSTVGDFGLGTIGGKLGGPKDGSYYYVTRPGPSGSGTSANHMAMLYSPFFDLSSSTDAILTFQQSIQTEPGVDRSIVQYSIDSGKTWATLGELNDPNGINWYGGPAYQNAAVNSGCWRPPSLSGFAHAFDASWTSDGECTMAQPGNSPAGYVRVIYNMDGLPPDKTPLGHNYVRFRYVTYCDFSVQGDGWAIDSWSLGPTPQLHPADFSGRVYHDVDANGIFDGPDSGLANVTVTLTYYGGLITKTATTDASGNYVFTGFNSMDWPGVYNAVANVGDGVVIQHSDSVDFVSNGISSSNHNIGYFKGSISGRIFDDLNGNGVDDGDPGIANIYISISRISDGGQFIALLYTNASGNYSQNVGPGTYEIRTDNIPYARRTLRSETDTIIISPPGGTASAIRNNVSFGFYKSGRLRVVASIDQNGNGVADPSDITGLGVAIQEAFTFSQNGTVLRTDTIGHGTSEYYITGLDTGTYTLTLNVGSPAQPGYLLTNAPVRQFTVSQSSFTDTARFLWYKYATAGGRVYDDLNGNGMKDSGEPGVEGWAVRLDSAAVETTDVDGMYGFDALSPGTYVLELLQKPGIDCTNPPAGGKFTFTPTSGQNVSNQNFGIFTPCALAGTVYRDRDRNGQFNSGDLPLENISVMLSRNDSALTPVLSAADGNFIFTGLHPGSYTVTVPSPSGYERAEPESSSSYTFDAVSGATLSNNNFGLFRLADTVRFRTIIALDVNALSTKLKPSKNVRKDTLANLTNFLNASISGAHVGLVGTKKVAWMRGKSYKDVEKSLMPLHVGTPSGFDSTAKNRPMRMGYMSIPTKTQDNVLFMNLLILDMNIAASDLHLTPGGLGDLKVADGGVFDGMSVRTFADSANKAMTFWKGVAPSTFAAMNALAVSINNAFHTSFDYDTSYFRHTGKVFLAGFKSAYQTGFLNPATSIRPSGRLAQPDVVELPTEFELHQNYPNPFNPSTTIRLDVPVASVITASVFNVLGQEVAVLLNNVRTERGVVELPFNASNLPSGVYFYRVSAEPLESGTNGVVTDYSRVMRMILLK